MQKEKDTTMLSAMRSGTRSVLVKILLFGLLLVAMAGLVFMDVQGVFKGGISDATVARIGRGKITAGEFSRLVDNELRRQGLPRDAALRAGLPQQILSQEIGSRVYARAAQDLGYIVDDAAVARAVRRLIQPLVAQGATEKEALNRVLDNLGLSERGLTGVMRAQIAVDEMLGLAAAGASAPMQLVDDALKYKSETRRGAWFRLDAADAGKLSDPSEEELKAHYAAIAPRFARPERRDFSVLVLDRAALGIAATAPEADLKAYYEGHKSEFSAPETRVVSQAVAQDEGAARAIHEAALKSGGLEKAAQAEKASFIPAQSYTEGEMPVELASAAFAGKEGAVLEPLRSPLGWHVLHIEKITPEKTPPFAAVKDRIARELGESLALERLYDEVNEIDDNVAGGGTLAEAAQARGLKPRVFKNVAADGDGAGTQTPPAFDRVLQQVFTLQEGQAGQMIETPDGAFLLAAVDGVTPAENAPFEKVRAAVADSLRQKRATEALAAKAAAVTERLKLGESFDAVARDLGKTPASTGLLSRGTSADKAGVSANVLNALFALAKEGDAAALADGDSAIVLRLAERRVTSPARQKRDAEETGALRSALTRSLQSDILDQYRAHLLEEYDVTVNDRALQALFTPEGDEEG